MHRLLLSSFAIFAMISSSRAGDADTFVLNLNRSPYARIHNVPVSAVTIRDGFWSSRRATSAGKSLPTMLELLEEHGVVDNFRRLTGRKDAARQGPLYTDSDIYKWMEAAAYVVATDKRPDLEATFDRLAGEIVAAQEPSGYLNTYYQDERKNLRFTEMDRGHELYCLGHMLQAAIAYYRATGKRTLLDAGIRFADFLARDFGPDKRPLLSGHPEIELALIELYRTTGEKKYLDLAGYILHGDGERLKLRPPQYTYMFSGKPFTERTILEGHAVRAGYACSGAADYYLETGDPAYKATLERLWNDMVSSKMYLTGGIGSRSAGEAFGDAYELPNAKAYTESCAAIANMMWNWRMLAATADARYTDVLETALYNSVNSGMSLEGTLYCYRNPLELTEDAARRIRNPWYSTTCCPPNLERIFASLPAYFYGTSREGVYVHLYDNSELKWKLEDGTPIRIEQSTKYPWDGTVELTVTPAASRDFTVFVRIPAWSQSSQVSVGGKRLDANPKPGEYLPIRRQWTPGEKIRLVFDMKPQVLVSDPRVVDNQGRAAVKRGPLVYALEQTDQPAGVPVLEAGFRLSADPSRDFTPEFRPDLLGGVTILRHRGALPAKPAASRPLYAPLSADDGKAGKSVDLILIPYYAFLNRAPAAMQVWATFYRLPGSRN